MDEFLREYPLYKEYLLVEDYKIGNEFYYDPSQFIGVKFKHFCEVDNEETIFNLTLEKGNHFNRYSYEDSIPEFLFLENRLNFTFVSIGTCQKCEQCQIHFLLHVYSDNPISYILNNVRNIKLSDRPSVNLVKANIYIQKVGQYPQAKFEINKTVKKFLDKESLTFYFKGLRALNSNLGVGSLAYFRRILERELIHIVKEIKELPSTDKIEVQKLIDEYDKGGKASSIYNNIFPFLPNSLRSIDINPLQLLYSLMSEGLHIYTEEQALEKAQKIKKLLEFVIIQINEEKSTLKDIRQIVKDLRPDQ
ncbi:hypothetical protein [Chryseobacterium gleum]|uniref:hypothetical protein n=1 Tax=Chryseobacterium gleum TaxID=250 RepID=UPI0028A26253|nr:hypothetical protein [Chryseobacterium gleum]